jgi:hypothetical protein
MPSGGVYDFIDAPMGTDLISLPEVKFDRGGLRYPTAAEIEAYRRREIEDAEAFAGWGWIGQVY